MTWLASNWLWVVLIGGGALFMLRRGSGHGHGGYRSESRGHDYGEGRGHRGHGGC